MVNLNFNTIVLFITFFVYSSTSESQNLIPDPGFEKFKKEIDPKIKYGDYMEFWEQGAKFVSNADINFYRIKSGVSFVRSRHSGLDDVKYRPRSGQGFSELIGCNPDGGDAILTPLTDPLRKDSLYLFRGYVRLTDTSRYCINRFQVDFGFNKDSMVKYGKHNIRSSNFNYKIKNKYGHYNTVYAISDSICYLCKNDWVMVKSFYLAEGGEKFLRFGTFHQDYALFPSYGESKTGDKVNCHYSYDENVYDEMLSDTLDMYFHDKYRSYYLLDDFELKKASPSLRNSFYDALEFYLRRN